MRIRQLGDPILRKTSSEVNPKDIASQEIVHIIEKMQDILDGIKNISSENGNAISAPQVGHLVRIILLRLNGEFVPMINPEFILKSEQMFDFEEECFSFYNLRGTVSRHYEVEVTYLNSNGEQQRRVMHGEESGLVQHEVDHLDGIFFADRMPDNKEMLSVDYLLKDTPLRLKQVKEMMAYMVG